MHITYNLKIRFYSEKQVECLKKWSSKSFCVLNILYAPNTLNTLLDHLHETDNSPMAGHGGASSKTLTFLSHIPLKTLVPNPYPGRVTGLEKYAKGKKVARNA